MNARMLIAATAATLFATMGTTAYAQEAQNDAQPPRDAAANRGRLRASVE